MSAITMAGYIAALVIIAVTGSLVFFVPAIRTGKKPAKATAAIPVVVMALAVFVVFAGLFDKFFHSGPVNVFLAVVGFIGAMTTFFWGTAYTAYVQRAHADDLPSRRAPDSMQRRSRR